MIRCVVGFSVNFTLKPVFTAAAINMSIECVFEVHTHCAHCECLVFALYAHFTSQVCIGVRLHLGQVHIWWHLVNIRVAADVTCIWVHYVSPICRQIVNLSFYKLATDGSDIKDMLRLVSKQHTINLLLSAWLDALPAGRYRFRSESETGVLKIFYERHDMKSDHFFSRKVQDDTMLPSLFFQDWKLK